MFFDSSIILPDLIGLVEWIVMVPNSSWSEKPILFYNQFYKCNGRTANVFVPAQQQRGGEVDLPPWRKKFYIFENRIFCAIKLVP